MGHGSPSACVTWTYINTHKLHWDVGRIALACCSNLDTGNDIRHLQACLFTVKQYRSCRGHHHERLDKGLLYPKPEVQRLSRPGIEPGPPQWEAIALEKKSHLNSLLMLVRTSTYEVTSIPCNGYNSLPVRVMPGLRLAPLRPVEFSSERMSLGFTGKEMATIFSYNIAKFNMKLLPIRIRNLLPSRIRILTFFYRRLKEIAEESSMFSIFVCFVVVTGMLIS